MLDQTLNLVDNAGMNPDVVFLEFVRMYRIFQRMLILNRRTLEEWRALNALDTRAKRRFDRLERRWLYAQDLGPYPPIPGMDPSERPSADANWTDASTIYNAFYHGIMPQIAN